MKFSLILSLVALLAGTARAGPSTTQAARSDTPVRVYVNQVEPFAFYNKEKELDGIEVVLLREVAKRMQVSFEFAPLPDPALKDRGLAGTDARLMFGAVTINSARMKNGLHFSQPTYVDSMRIAVPWDGNKKAGAELVAMLRDAAKPVQLVLAPILFVSCVSIARSLRAKSRAGMYFFGISILAALVTSGFMITSHILAAQKQRSTEEIARIWGPEDLLRLPVSTKAFTPSVARLKGYRARVIECPTTEAAIEMVLSGKAKAVAHEGAVLEYTINRDNRTLTLVGRPFDQHCYGVVLRPDEDPEFIARFNTALLGASEDEKVRAMMESYLRH